MASELGITTRTPGSSSPIWRQRGREVPPQQRTLRSSLSNTTGYGFVRPAAISTLAWLRRGRRRQPLRRAQRATPVFAPLRGTVAADGEDPDVVAEQIRGSPDIACPLSRRLKDVVFVKEMRDAMASGEFAVSLSGAQQLALIDYQNLCNKLHNFACKLEQDEIETDVLSPLERAKNLAQLSKICDQLEEYILKMAKTDWQSKGASSSGDAKSGGLPDPRRLFWYVRDDQTVDLDGAFSDPGKAARFSRDLWERLNGQSHGGEPKTPPSDSPRAAARAVALKAAKDAAANAEEARQRFLAKAADQLGPKRSSLEAPPAPGADELRELRSELRGYEEEVRNRRSLVSLRTIEWLLQRSADELERDLLGTNMSL